MSEFIVSARKYRPTTWESVVGQMSITNTLVNAISTNQLAHAYLFCGPRGVGKTTSLKQFVSQERKKGKKVAGILQIVQNDRRYLQFLSTNIEKQKS